MGRIIQKNNGKTTVFTTGENFNSLTPITNTCYVGANPSFEVGIRVSGGDFDGDSLLFNTPIEIRVYN